MESLEFDESALEKTPRFSTPSFRAKWKPRNEKPRQTDSPRFPSFPRTPSFQPRPQSLQDHKTEHGRHQIYYHKGS